MSNPLQYSALSCVGGAECSRDFYRKVTRACIQTLNKCKKKKKPEHLCNKDAHLKGARDREREREGERENVFTSPLPVVPAAPVNSPTWRKRAEEEREREEGGTATRDWKQRGGESLQV